MKLSSWH